MKTSIDNSNPSLTVKGSSGNKKIQSLKSSNQLNTAKNLNSLIRNISHQPSSSGTKLSYFANLNHSVEPKSKSPKHQKLKYSIISKKVMESQTNELNDKAKEKGKKTKYQNLRSYFQNPSRKSLDPSNIDAKGNERPIEFQFI